MIHETSQHGIKYTIYGSESNKLSLVCIHGWGCQSSDYEYFIPDLMKLNNDIQVIAIDLPGHGGSSTEHYPVASVSSLAHAFNTLLSELKAHDIVLMGHSMGVRIILEAWRQCQRPVIRTKQNVKGLIFMDGSHYGLRKALFAFDSGDARSKTLSEQERRAAKAEAFKRMFSKQTPDKFQAAALAHLNTIDEEYSDSIRRSFIDFDHESLQLVLAEVGASKVPVLNLQATELDEENHRVPLKSGQMSKYMQFVQDRVPEVQMAVIVESGHFPHVDQPAEVAKMVRDFLEEMKD